MIRNLPRAHLVVTLPAGLLLMFAALGAQTPAGTQQPPRNPLGDPLLASPEHVREDAFYKVPLHPEDRKYADNLF